MSGKWKTPSVWPGTCQKWVEPGVKSTRKISPLDFCDTLRTPACEMFDISLNENAKAPLDDVAVVSCFVELLKQQFSK